MPSIKKKVENKQTLLRFLKSEQEKHGEWFTTTVAEMLEKTGLELDERTIRTYLKELKESGDIQTKTEAWMYKING